MNDNDKLALIDGSAKVQTQIEIRPLIAGETSLILREYNYISKWDMEDYKYVPNHGFIGQFVERILNVSLKNLPTDAKFENKELVLKLGVLTDAGVTWYSLGTFLIYKAKYDDVAGLWNLKGKDFCKKFNKKYEDTITYPCTALQLATNVCSQCGCSLATTNFKNKDFVINENQFVNGETCREVMKAIGMLAFTWVRIGWDNRVYLDFDKKTTVDPKNKITNDNYYDLKVTREVYGPVNRILIGLSNVTGENVYVEDAESIEQNGLCELDLYDNPLTYTEELRELAIENASGLLGLTYTPVELNTTGYPWLNGNELIEIVDMENGSLQTYAFDRRIEYFGHIKSSIKAQSISNVESTYKYNGSIKERIKRTEISVDKANGKISLVAETVDTIEKEITPTGQASGSNIHISDSADAELLDFKLYGKSVQETRSGRNLFNYKDTRSVTNGASSDEDGWITVTYDNTSGASTIWSNYYTYNLKLKPNTQYAIFTEIKSVSGTGRFIPYGHNNPQTQGQFPTEKVYNFSLLSAGMIVKDTPTTLEDFSNIIYGLRTLVSFRAGESGSITFRISVLEDTTITADNFEYEAFGVRPSPDYPSEIKSVGYTNLFNNTFNKLSMWDTVAGGTTAFTTGNQYLGAYCKVEENKTYSVSREKLTSRFAVAFCNEEPTINSKALVHLRNDSALKMENITVPTGYNYLVFYLSNSSETTDDINLQVVESPIAHTYIPFGKYGVEVETIGKNKLNPNAPTKTTYGVTVTNNGDGTFTAKGTSTNALSIPLTTDILELKNGKTYTNSIEILSGSLDNGTIAVTVKNTNDKTTYNYINLYNNVLSNTKTPTEDLKTTGYGFYVGSAGKTFDVTFRVQLEESDKKTSWEEYKKTTTLIQSDYPLMSNKDETIRDYLYLQNGNLYLKKVMNEVVLNGSENWILSGYSNDEILSVYNELLLSGLIKENTPAMSNYFNYVPNVSYSTITPYISINNHTLRLGIPKVIASSIEDLKNWLSNNNVKVVFEMNQPQDILIAENVDSLITYKNVTNISTNDDLQPNMEIVYVKDNALNEIYQTQNGMNKYYTKVENDAQIEIVSDEIKSSVTEIESAMGTIEGALETLKSTYLSQTADQFEMLFKETGIKEIVDSVDKLTKSNNATLVEQEQWIRFKGGNIELGRSDSQVKLLLSNDKILFMTGGNESAYISNNQLYITDSTILNKLQVGHWETKEENGNLNTRWIEGVI